MQSLQGPAGRTIAKHRDARNACMASMQQPARPSTVAARYVGSRSSRSRKDLVWDNLSNDETQYNANDILEPLQPQADTGNQSADNSMGNTPETVPLHPPSRSQSHAQQQTAASDAMHSINLSWGVQGSPAENGWGETRNNSEDDDGGWGMPAYSSEWGGGRQYYANGYQEPQQYTYSGSPGGQPEPEYSGRWGTDPSKFNNQQGFNNQATPEENSQADSRQQAAGDTPPWQFFADNGRESTTTGRGPPPGMNGTEQPPQPPRPSDVTLLSRTEMEAVLPVTPNGRQADYFRPRSLSERIVQVMGSVGASMVLSKSATLAAPALLFPLWSPWIRAALKNAEVFGGAVKCMGLWRAEVLEVEILQNNTFRPGSWGGRAAGRAAPPAAGPSLRLMIGDPWEGGARVHLEFPYQPKCELLQVGEPIEALVLSRDDTFHAFKVIREVYTPGLGLWLAEYPFLDRGAFLDVSLQVERSRQADPSYWVSGSPAVRYTVDVDITEPGQDTQPGWSTYAADYQQPGYDQGSFGYVSDNGGVQGEGHVNGTGVYGANTGSSSTNGNGFTYAGPGGNDQVQGMSEPSYGMDGNGFQYSRPAGWDAGYPPMQQGNFESNGTVQSGADTSGWGNNGSSNTSFTDYSKINGVEHSRKQGSGWQNFTADSSVDGGDKGSSTEGVQPAVNAATRQPAHTGA